MYSTLKRKINRNHLFKNCCKYVFNFCIFFSFIRSNKIKKLCNYFIRFQQPIFDLISNLFIINFYAGLINKRADIAQDSDNILVTELRTNTILNEKAIKFCRPSICINSLGTCWCWTTLVKSTCFLKKSNCRSFCKWSSLYCITRNKIRLSTNLMINLNILR